MPTPRRAALLLGLLFLGATAWAGSAQGPTERVEVPGGTLQVEFSEPPSPALKAAAAKWIADSARAVANYFGTFPVRQVTLHFELGDGHGPSGGQTFGWNGALIKITLGRKTTAADLADEWVLPHEMVHLNLPNVAEKHHWIEEGLATYIEPVARARVGQLTPQRVWGDLVENLPQGEPEKGDRGLDHTPTWGRTYWGGALFCLRADVEIRRRTGNRLGLEHAMRAIHTAGGSIEASWEIDRVIAVGDKATGVPVLRELYDEMKGAPDPVDLPALWKQLGVVRHKGGVTFDDQATLSAIRKAITGG